MRTITTGLVILATIAIAFTALAVSPEDPKLILKVGDEVYACACGATCPCKSLSMQPAKCTCGVDMVKSKVVKIEGDMATITVNGKDETFPTKGKFVCSCGSSCPCNYISQSAGKCACGKDLAPAK